MLTFDEKAHRYTWNGNPVLNVTRALDLITDYSSIPPKKLEVARQKGVAVHAMVEYHARGDLDLAGLPSWMGPVFEQWRKFLFETGFKLRHSEYRVYHPLYQYAGTLDLFGTIGDEFVFVDVKRSFLAGEAIGFQLAAYLEAYCAQEKAKARNARRYALRLNENGPYRMERYDNKADFQNFLTCLNFYRLKERFNERSRA